MIALVLLLIAEEVLPELVSFLAVSFSILAGRYIKITVTERYP